MKILYRYVIRMAFYHSFLAMILCTAVFLTADFFEKVDDLIEFKVGFGISASYFLYRLPFMVAQVWAPSFFIGSLVAMVVFHHRKETVAVRAAGIGPRAYFIPIICLALASALSFFIFRETLEKPFFVKSQELWTGHIHRHSVKTSGHYGRNIWYATGDKIIRAAFYDPPEMVFHRVSIFSVDEDFALKERLDADLMVWDGEKWILRNARIYRFRPDGLVLRSEPVHDAGLKERPDELMTFRFMPDVLEFRQLYRLIRLMSSEGLGTRPYQIELFTRLADAMWVFAASILGAIMGNHRRLAPNAVKILAGGFLAYGGFFGLYQAGLALISATLLPISLGFCGPFILMLLLILWWSRSTV